MTPGIQEIIKKHKVYFQDVNAGWYLRHFADEVYKETLVETLEDIEAKINTWGGDERYNQAIKDVIDFIKSKKEKI